MTQDGVQRALVFLTSAFSSYSGCRQYRENLYVAQEAVGPDAPELPRLRLPFNHPGFVEANADRLRDALMRAARPGAQVAFTAHSIPVAMAERCAYEAQLAESARLVAEAAGAADYAVVYQSRSGPPHVPWLGPDILDHLRDLHGRGVTDVVVAPLGFLSDHLEVLYDLDVEAAELADELGLRLVRAGTPGTHPALRLGDPRADPGAARRAAPDARRSVASRRTRTRARPRAACRAPAGRARGMPSGPHERPLRLHREPGALRPRGAALPARRCRTTRGALGGELGDPSTEIHQGVLVALAEVGIDASDHVPQKLNDELTDWADVVVATCDGACPAVPGKRYVAWELPDPIGQQAEDVRPLRDDVERRVTALADELSE